ncbi:MAG: CvpA family protein [Treponema sp.]|jgi:membrane protein required for colicin V production|nr:CvpA family protein [Treponema sp.]
MSFNTLDIIFVAIITLFTVRCYVKGFAQEFLSMAAIVLAVLASVFFYKNAADFLRSHFWPDSKTFPEIIAFVGLFLIVFIIVKIIEIMVQNIIEKIEVGKGDRFLGVIFGLAEGIAIVSFILFLLKVQPIFDSSVLLSESFFARIMLPLITGRENMLNV